MWPLPQLKNEHLHLVVHHDHVVCARFVQEIHGVRMVAHVYEFPLGNKKILCNLAALENAVLHGIKAFGVEFAFCSMVLGSGLMRERFVVQSSSDPSYVNTKMNIHQSTHYVGPLEDRFLFYLMSYSELVKLQLDLFHARLPIHLGHIITPFHAQTHIYRHIAGKAFSHARLAQDVDIDTAVIPAVFSAQMLKRSVQSVPSSVQQHDVVLAWGSFLGVS